MYTNLKLTDKQYQVFNFISSFKKIEGVVPTYREISRHFGFKSPKAALDHVRALERKGYVRRHGNKSRSIEIVSEASDTTDHIVSVPILGEISAGIPHREKDRWSGTIAVSESLLGECKSHRLFAVQVNGDSMIGRNICDGDWVVIDADMPPKVGSVVVALIDGDTTLKTLAKKKRCYYLKSENPDYQDWIPMEEMTVQGVVKALVRQKI